MLPNRFYHELRVKARVGQLNLENVRSVPGFPVCPRFLGFEAEVNGDRNVRGNGLAVPRRWLVLVFLQGFDSGRAQ